MNAEIVAWNCYQFPEFTETFRPNQLVFQNTSSKHSAKIIVPDPSINRARRPYICTNQNTKSILCHHHIIAALQAKQRENLLASKRNDFYVQKCKYKGEKKIQRAYRDLKMRNGNTAVTKMGPQLTGYLPECPTSSDCTWQQ